MEPCNQKLSNDKVPLSKGNSNTIQFTASSGRQNQNLKINKLKHDDKLSLIANYNKPNLIKMNGIKTIKMHGDCDSSENQQSTSSTTDNEDSLSTPRLGRLANTLPNLFIANQLQTNQISSGQNSPLFIRQQGSFRYGRPTGYDLIPYTGRPGSETPTQISRLYSENSSIPSWTSVGLGCTDGKKLIIRKVPTSPIELMNIVNPPS